jgi:hypothetical protein
MKNARDLTEAAAMHKLTKQNRLAVIKHAIRRAAEAGKHFLNLYETHMNDLGIYHTRTFSYTEKTLQELKKQGFQINETKETHWPWLIPFIGKPWFSTYHSLSW